MLTDIYSCRFALRLLFVRVNICMFINFYSLICAEVMCACFYVVEHFSLRIVYTHT